MRRESKGLGGLEADSPVRIIVETSFDGNGKETGTIESEAKSTDVVFPPNVQCIGEQVMEDEEVDGNDPGHQDHDETDPELSNKTVAEESEMYIQKYFRDHFTLPTPSSTIRFRSANSAVRVFENQTTQFVLEETYNPEDKQRKIQVKRLTASTTGLQFLRGIYTTVCVLWTGIFFVACLQVLLILVLDLAVQSGATNLNTQLNIIELVGYVTLYLLTWCGANECSLCPLPA
jgi:hypothetical protein